MVSSVNKYKISLEPAKHINDRVVKLLHQTEETRERNIENRTLRSKIKSNRVIVSQNYPITDYYKFLHDQKITNQTAITTFCTAKTTIKSQLQVFAPISPVQLRINCIPCSQSDLSNFAQHVIN